MKRIIAILLTLLLVFSLAACGEQGETPSGSNTDNPGTSQGENQGGDENNGTKPDLDFGAIMADNGSTSTVWGEQDEATKQQIINDAKADG